MDELIMRLLSRKLM